MPPIIEMITPKFRRWRQVYKTFLWKLADLPDKELYTDRLVRQYGSQNKHSIVAVIILILIINERTKLKIFLAPADSLTE